MRVILIGLLLGVPPAFAQESVRDAVMDGAERCAGIADDRNWLDCFYGSAQPMRARLGLAPAPQSQTQLVPPPGAAYTAASPRHAAETRAPEKGFFASLLGSTGPVAANMPMQSYVFGDDGRFTVRLANGQVYQQEEGDLIRAHWGGPANALLVSVQSAGDKYTLKVKGEPGAVYRVRRR